MFTDNVSIDTVPMCTIINLSITFSPTTISYSFTFDNSNTQIKEYLIYFTKYNDNDKYYKLETITRHKYNVGFPSSYVHIKIINIVKVILISLIQQFIIFVQKIK